VSSGESNTVAVYDPTTRTFRPPTLVGLRPGSLAVNPTTGQVFVANRGSSSITVLE
jgi:DNA-binding beta-propeller fold protein YncE